MSKKRLTLDEAADKALRQGLSLIHQEILRLRKATAADPTALSAYDHKLLLEYVKVARDVKAVTHDPEQEKQKSAIRQASLLAKTDTKTLIASVRQAVKEEHNE